MEKLLIIQTSPARTASTFLVNALYGLIPECSNLKIREMWRNDFDKFFKNIIIVKNHNTNIDELIKLYKNYKTVFICSEREEINALIDAKYKTYDNVIVFRFEELNETNDNPLVQIVDNIYTKVKDVLPPDIELNQSTCIERINNMNIRCKEIQNMSFNYVDDFFEIHGSHRNRG